VTRELADVLHASAARTFEQLTFSLPLDVPSSPNAQHPSPITLTASVDFRGPFVGRLEVGVTASLLPTIAANMLGQDDPPPLAEQHDALRELANVICGNLLPEIAGPGPLFALAAPSLDAAGATDQPLAADVQLAFDEGTARLRLFVDPGVLA
jgi:hypothetical protein